MTYPHRSFNLRSMLTVTIRRAPDFASHEKSTVCLPTGVPTKPLRAGALREELMQRSSNKADWLSTETNCSPIKTTPRGMESL